MEFHTFFNVDEHFKQINRKIIKCISASTVYLRLTEIMPEFFEIFNNDIENIITQLYADINYQRAMKQIKISDNSFRKLIDDGFPVLFNNYKRVVEGIGGGSLLRNTCVTKQDFDLFEIQSQKLYNQTSGKLFLQSKKDKRNSINNWLILSCTVIAAITGIIALIRVF